MTTAKDALTVQLEYFDIFNGSNLGLTRITLWVTGYPGH